MDDNHDKNSLPAYQSQIPDTRKARSRKLTMRVTVGTILAVVLAIAAYSVYVAVHEPDPQETVVLGQTKLAVGSPAALRILVRNRVSGQPVKGASVELHLRGKATSVKLGSFRTDAAGSIADSIAIPDVPPGTYELVLESRSDLGSDRVVKKVEVQHSIRIFLSSDKPVYQPGQTIHLRSLMLNARTQKPFAGEAVTFEVKDPKGNKVFKEIRKSSAFGIASADFVLASELNLGRYEICANAGATTTERTVEVKRYVLPRFKISIVTSQPYYLPGQTVSGSVRASYFFGRPVSGGTVKLTATTFHGKPVVITELQGRTDNDGNYSFQFALPDFFAGMPQMNEQAFLDLKAELRDTAQHAEEKALSLTVARGELGLTVIPESGALVPGVENLLYVLTAYPDGRPAVCRVMVDGMAYQSDAQGVSEVRLGPQAANRHVDIQAIDSGGRRARASYRPDANGPIPALLLRSDKAVYKAGQSARLTIIAPEEQNAVFIDVIHDNQTVLTKTVALKNHRASYTLALPPSLVGALKVHAYLIAKTGEDRGCARIIYVNPASGLRVATGLSKAVYRPGEVAKLDFTVTDAEGRPTPAALGIAAVDESVFALHENRPGLLQQFLDAEGELLKPRYQIRMFDCPGRFLSGAEGDQALAQAYFASLDSPVAGLEADELVRGGYIPAQLVEHARAMRGTPAYEKYRQDPRYAEVMSLLEGERGIYSLREATGRIKLQSAEARREAYFKRLKQGLQIGFCGLLFLLPLFLSFRYSRPEAGINPQIVTQAHSQRYAAIAGATYNLLAVLTLLPLVGYPLGFLVLGHSGVREAAWILPCLEAVVVLGALAVLRFRILGAGSEGLEPELVPLRGFIGAFLIQFVVSRLGFASLAFQLGYGGSLVFLWFLGSVAAPLVVLGGLDLHVRRQLKAKGIKARVACINVAEVLCVIAIICILAALLLPALSRAKAKAQRISLLNDLKQLELANLVARQDGIRSDAGSPAAPRVRRDFPETLLWQPELITDGQGKASLEIPLADSITTWRASVEGISAGGKMGSAEVPITVFQDFFVDLDLPVAMSLGDQISVPVTCYNYLKTSQDIRLTVAPGAWFAAPSHNLSVHLAPNEVKSASFPLKVLRAGRHSLRVTALGTSLADAVEREVRVVPTGEQVEHTRNAVLKANWTDRFTIPGDVVPDSQSLWVKFYPSRFTEIVEGLESIFQVPHGCFEQTSSTTYPSVLVLDYLKHMGRLTPEIEVRARKFINTGYQRLLTFEVAGGGFEWFGHSPAHVGLTAYGVLEFTDMNRVHPVDPNLIDRTRQWLFSRQNADGSWNQASGLHSWSDKTLITAYVAWALAESGDSSPNLDNALNYLRHHPEELSTTYQKALAANALLARDRDDSFGRELAGQIQQAVVADRQGTLHWTSAGQSVTCSHGTDLNVETTALSAMALMKGGSSPELVKQALGWLSRQKTATGTWGSTQATILAMRALLAGSTASFGQEFDSAVTLLLNGEAVETFPVNKENNDVMRQADLTRHLRPGENQIEFRQTPVGELAFQLAGVYWLPAVSRAQATTPPGPAPFEPLQIVVRYDRTTLAVNAQLECAVTVSNNTGQVINMAIVDLGIPPGFDVDTTAFERLQEKGAIARFEATGNQVILYLRQLPTAQPFQFEYSLRAKYPLRVQPPPSAVYEYYQPKNRAETRPAIVQVLGD
ncbi:MAG TPA: MG2 domain-containing protein [Candidatus Paceibacterota bacterium]|nr:MG2 domain-containing protein [Verrucomicrobiota bacterium]HSA09402.1 MG2 domain-containing protein [Candidatus Paceibacterota bacterium]